MRGFGSTHICPLPLSVYFGKKISEYESESESCAISIWILRYSEAHETSNLITSNIHGKRSQSLVKKSETRGGGLTPIRDLLVYMCL